MREAMLVIAWLVGCQSEDAAIEIATPDAYVYAVDGASDAGVAPRNEFVVDGAAPDAALADAGANQSVPDASAPTIDASAADAAIASGCSGRTGRAGDSLLSITSGGRGRIASLHVPASYDPARETMLVVNLHGLGSAGWQEALLTGMTARADDDGFIVVYPRGINWSWNAGSCCGAPDIDDVAFIGALLDRLEADYCVDRRRVFVTGMSNGGFLAQRLMCEMSDRFAAGAPVAGVLTIDPALCTPPRAMPILHVHGTADPLVPYDGGRPLGLDLGGLTFMSVAQSMEHWRTHNGCEATRTTTYAMGDARCEAYVGCDAPTELCTIEGGGHAWPGGLAILPGTSRDLDATARIIDFFEANPMLE